MVSDHVTRQRTLANLGLQLACCLSGREDGPTREEAQVEEKGNQLEKRKHLGQKPEKSHGLWTRKQGETLCLGGKLPHQAHDWFMKILNNVSSSRPDR